MHLKDSVQMTVLPNGMTVITDYYDRPVDDRYRGMMAANIVVHCGSLHDPVGKNGLAHFSEHMMYHALSDIPRKQLQKDIAVLGLRSDNLETGPQDSQYYAQGRQAAVEAYMTLVARMMTEAAYTQEHVEEEKGRIISEMKDRLTTKDRLHWYHFNRAVYGQQIHGRWTGGLPKDMARFTVQDIRDYHARAHSTGNLVLITSGGWSHDQACAWAETHLSGLPVGPRIQKQASALQKGRVFFQDPFLYHPEAGQMVKYRIHFGTEQLISAEHEALFLANRVAHDSLGQLSNSLGAYDIQANTSYPGTTDNLRDFRTTSYNGSKVEIERLRPVLYATVRCMREAIEHMNRDEFEQRKNLSIQGIEDYFRMNMTNPFERQDSILANYVRGEPLTYWEERVDIVRGLTYEQVRDVALRVYGQEPIPSYVAAQEFDFPTGPELQRVWNESGPAQSLVQSRRLPLSDRLDI